MSADGKQCTMANPGEVNRNEEVPDAQDAPRELTSAADILDVDDVEIIPLQMPEWGGTVYLRTLQSGEGDEIAQLMSSNKVRYARARVAIKCLCDKAGRPIFKPIHAQDLSEKSFSALDRILNKIVEMNHMGEDAQGALEGN